MKTNPVLGISQPLNNSQPLRKDNNQQAVSFKMAPVKVPTEFKSKANTLLETFNAAFKDCDIGLIEATKRKAARDKVPTTIVSAAIEQAQSGKQLLVYA